MSPWLKLSIAFAIVAAALGLGAWLRPSRVVTKVVAPAETATAPAVHLPPDAGGLVPAAEATREAPLTPMHPLSEALCPPHMAWASGSHCPPGFDGEQGCRVSVTSVAVCIDLFEYPNQVGVVPATMTTYPEAEQACLAEGKRLCTDSEWTFACRGTSSLSACRFGMGKPRVRRNRLWRGSETSEELARIDARRVSGRTPCVSAHGVYDLPGNLEEWVRGENDKGYTAALKGGHFNKGSIGCERSFATRELGARSPYVGFRCCRGPLVEPPRGIE